MENSHSISEQGAPASCGVRCEAWIAGFTAVLFIVLFYTVGVPFSIAVLGQAAGLAGLVFIVLSLLLMLRLPALANFVGGLEAMYTLHRGFGLAGYGFVLLHPLLLAQKGGWDVLTMAGKDFDFRSGWTSALVLMLILFCTFILKTGGYAIWRRLHMLSMIAFLFMAWHVMAYQPEWSPAGKLFLNVLLLAGLLIPLARYLLVDRGILASPFVIAQVGHPASGVVEVLLNPSARPLAIEPGQFVFARFLSDGQYTGCEHFHPFTASAVESDGSLRLSIKSSGACTHRMQHLAPGGRVLLQGPFGNLFQNVRRDTQVWIAGGIGITPFLARLRALEADHGPVALFYFYDQVTDAPFLDELAALVRSKSMVTYLPIATLGASEPIPIVFDALLPPWDDKHYVLCGSEGFTGFVRDYLSRHGVKPDAVSQERFEFR